VEMLQLLFLVCLRQAHSWRSLGQHLVLR
jgi:hypothetical protein